MRIKGIGTISKKEAMSILTREGREAVKMVTLQHKSLARCTS